ncbi:MAG: DNA mismatch repair protein MutS [Candidatus Thermofonsia Clade 3 bacterium]|jgi:DNA mismatch repair protein MutS|uniref:DNA mismatch repair protein MutS n=1 Tax=Candidatus Thermofonsia Clade 3 bacterium TaxID=2364212 RepID=A0A2M8QDV9_9CHLR|nr:DNA mismatch repair protein MutS [Candidatus Roseilinea sp. NK_OTU-006]PJF47993.1 MAG: DNA mismatch repair protein MutS [Candidatus Thermofonsia Clade 3 bacterium]
MSEASATPIRRQYLELKRQYPDCILFFRLGDFYETFDADAELVARELDVALTSRPVAKDVRIPMAGVPHHAAEGYIARLIARGYRVAIADQVGNEAINGLMPREVRRVITPGTVVEPGMLDAARPNYLSAVIGAAANDERQATTQSPIGLAYCDITTGEFCATQLESRVELERELARIQPREMLTPNDGGRPTPAGRDDSPYPTTPLPSYRFELSHARQALLDHFKVSTLQGFGIEEKPYALRAAGAIIAYLRETQPAALSQLRELRTYAVSQFMGLDAVTRRNLELLEPLRPAAGGGKTTPTLLGVLDKTLSPMGARLLRAWIAQPLLDQAAIEARLAQVDALFGDALLRAKLRDALKQMPDLERLTTRVLSGIATPRDLLNLKAACARVVEIGDWRLEIAHRLSSNPQSLISDLQPLIAGLRAVADLIAAAIKDEPDDDGFIQPGFSAELDSVHRAARDAKRWVANLERVERERTGIKSLKVGYNKVFGYYIEVTHAHRDAIPNDYIRKQTLTNAERYITPQLKEYEALILNADERIAEIERRLLIEINQAIAAHARALLEAAQVIARLDVAAALAEVAARNHYCRPRFNDEGRIAIKDGRHPVIEHLLRETPFTPNDAHLDRDARILIITGPNMSGKSSYMRQVALIALMAQIGSYVPAREADLCIVDRIFTRIGAQDELTAGQSTFMVEMVETANILHHCTSRSLVILDEIGRGTSTYDGLAIAWAVVEYLHNHPEHRPLTLFATHYHELIRLADVLPHVRNYNVAVSEEGGQIVFLHKVIAGGADRSYGIHVAQLAGLPPAVVHRAQDVLKELENGQRAHERPTPTEDRPAQMSLFAEPSPALEKLKQLDPNALSPLEALTALYELKKLL